MPTPMATATQDNADPTRPCERSDAQTPRIVGIGASAGGLQALERFFAHVPPDSDMAYVVVQHTQAEHKTLLGTLLQSVTDLPVHDAAQGMVVAANAVYIMPTGGELTVVRGCLHFQASPKPVSAPWPIDIFLSSLAQDQGPRAVGVILSGMGRDGTIGLQAIHSAQGYCMAQQPESAAFSAMPLSAIDAGGVDAVAEPQDMPAQIVQWAQRTPTPPTSSDPVQRSTSSSDGPMHAQDLQSIVQLIQETLHHDFSLYKPSTLQRRVERRVQVHQLSSLSAYKTFLQNNPPELNLLFSEMLIGVTAFFRDPQVWLDVSTLVVPQLLTHHPERPLRAWVMGCSTGEEAYSLAMLLCQAQGNCAGPRRVVQIYATDLNPQAIAVARKGWFSETSMAGVTLEQRTRFFTPQQGGHVVSPEIRSMVMFAKHDVITDPPFTQLDLLMCRNVLIYFSATLQRRLIPLFHFSLRAGGALVLGSAETVGRSSHLFTTLAPKSRLYARREATLNPGSVAFPVHHRPALPSAIKDPSVNSAAPTSVDNLQTLADRVLLEGFSPAAVLVNAAGDILYINGRTGPYMEAATGKANWNLHVMLRPALRGPVALALRQALSERRAVVLNSLPLEGHIQRQLQVTVQALDDSSAWMNTAMVIFKEVEMNVLPEGVVGTAVGAVSIELQAAQLELQSLQLEMQTSKNELGAINGALKVANEELQVANEELTTSKEESQSMNEELQTINSELQTRLDDLALAQSDMQNLLNSTDIATLFLDNDLNVRRYTEQAVGIFHLRESDVGRPLSDLASILTYPHLQADVKETLRALTPCTKSVAATDGRWFSVRIMPYRTLANAVSGAVLTFVDISTAKALEFRLRESHLPETPSKDAP